MAIYGNVENIGAVLLGAVTSETIHVKGDKGDDGITPHIGENGNWYIGDIDTGQPSYDELTDEELATAVEAYFAEHPVKSIYTVAVTYDEEADTYTADKTFAEIAAANEAGQAVQLAYDGAYFYLNWIAEDSASFGATYSADGSSLQWDTVMMSADGSIHFETVEAGQADWNQNDENASDYIKNRTHWTEEKLVSSAIINEGATSGSMTPAADGYSLDEEYTVELNGVKYEGLKFEYRLSGVSFYYLGAAPNSISEDDFSIFAVNQSPNITNMVLSWGVGSAISIKSLNIYGAETHKIDSKYLPDGVSDVVDTVAAKMDKSNPVGTGSFSMNRKSGTTVGDYSHAEGQSTTASGNYSHAEGQSTTASGNYSHAEGQSTTASGNYSHAEGVSSSALGYASHAEGMTTYAKNNGAHAEGSSTIASGLCSHAEGAQSKATGNHSHAEGENTIASGKNSHAQGRLNVEDTEEKYAHIVGNGEYTSDGNGVRSNAHTLDWDGVAWFQGRPQFGGNAQDDGSQTVVANGDKEIILASSTEGSTETHTITVDDTDGLLLDGESEIGKHNTSTTAHNDIRALIRKTWYVTVTRASDGTVTADKTPQEIYEAYQAGFTVYAMTSTFPGFNNVPFLIPCLAAIEFFGTYQIGFAASGTTAATTSPTSMVIFYDGSTWYMWDHKLVSTDDIVDNLTTGDSTKVLSAAQGKVLKELIDECGSTLVVEISQKPNDDKVFIADKSFNEIAVAYENGAEVKAVYLGQYEMPLVYMGDDKFVFNAIYDGALLTAVINSDNNVVDMVAQDVFPEETDPTVPAWAKAAEKPTYTAAEVGADASGTAAAAVSAHNASSAAHNDIRQLISSLTSSKVSVSDIVNNLTSDDTDKPLSAAQGKVLKGLIDGIDIPTVPTALPNPNALTIKIGSSTVVYDGSAAKTVEIADGSEVEY